jgi:hypothetical protein
MMMMMLRASRHAHHQQIDYTSNTYAAKTRAQNPSSDYSDKVPADTGKSIQVKQHQAHHHGTGHSNTQYSDFDSVDDTPVFRPRAHNRGSASTGSMHSGTEQPMSAGTRFQGDKSSSGDKVNVSVPQRNYPHTVAFHNDNFCGVPEISLQPGM